MKNFYYSLVFFSVILMGSIFSDVYTKKQIVQFKSYLNSIESADKETALFRIKTAKEEYFKQKNMLRLFISKEHIYDFEKNIIFIENHLENGNKEESHQIILETLLMLSEIDDNIIF